MCALPFEHVFDGYEAIIVGWPVGYAQIVSHVREQTDIHIFEDTGANVVGLGSDQLLGDAGPDFKGSLKMVPLHHFFRR